MYMNYRLNQMENRYLAYHCLNREHYEIGYLDYKIMLLLQEGYSMDYICEQLAVPIAELKKNISQLSDMGFLSPVSVKQKRSMKWNKIYLFSLNTSHLKPNLLTKLLEQIVIWFSLLALVGLAIVISQAPNLWNEMVSFESTNLFELGFVIVGCQILTVILHEFCHLIFAINRGANVPEMGVMLYFLSPSGYSDLTQIHFFKHKSSKIVCLLAGLMFNFGLMVFSLFSFLIFNLQIFQVLFYLNLITILINFGFYIKLDGYYILQILLDEKYLREQSLKVLKNLHWNGLTLKDLVFYVVGFCSIVYFPILFINILMSVWGYFL